MSGCIRPPSCLCGTCLKCRKRASKQYARARNRGDKQPRRVCRCGECFHCHERQRKADYDARKAAAAAKGEQLAKSPAKEREAATRARKEAVAQEWAERAARERAQAPLNDRQRKEVEQIVTRQIAALLLGE